MSTPFTERLRNAFLKPLPETPVNVPQAPPRTIEELEHDTKYADDKERLVGLIGAPFAAAIALLVTNALIAHDPPRLLKNGALNRAYTSVSLYHNLELVLLGVTILMLVMAWFRKRLYLGIVMAMYGLGIFNLHYWGFGVPFIMAGAWLLVRAYRQQRASREATGEPMSRGNTTPTRSFRPRENKRYTPPRLR